MSKRKGRRVGRRWACQQDEKALTRHSQHEEASVTTSRSPTSTGSVQENQWTSWWLNQGFIYYPYFPYTSFTSIKTVLSIFQLKLDEKDNWCFITDLGATLQEQGKVYCILFLKQFENFTWHFMVLILPRKTVKKTLRLNWLRFPPTFLMDLLNKTAGFCFILRHFSYLITEIQAKNDWRRMVLGVWSNGANSLR